MARGDTHTATEVGRRAAELPRAAASAVGPSGAYCSREEAAEILGLSVGGLALAMARGECEGLFSRFGRCVRFHRPALAIRAAGLGDPAALGAFVRAAGIAKVADLLAWLDGGSDE